MKLTKFFSLIVLMAAMTACGGGGGSAGVTSNNSGAAASTSPIVSSIADYIFELDKTSIKNSGTDSVALSVTTLDVARNVVPNVPVSIAVDSGGVFLPATGLVTDALGKFNGKITAGGDKTDRIINATITVNGIKKTVTFGVTGSQISVTPVPAVPQQGETVTLNIRVADAANIGIANVPVVARDLVAVQKLIWEAIFQLHPPHQLQGLMWQLSVRQEFQFPLRYGWWHPVESIQVYRQEVLHLAARICCLTLLPLRRMRLGAP
jgi:hypothetical protein